MKVRIVSEAFAIMPPLEQFIEVCFEERRELFYRNVEHGDVVIGRINSVRVFVTLLCAAGELERDIEDQEIKVGFYIYQTLLSKATYGIQCIQAIHILVSTCYLGIKPTTFALLMQCSTYEPHRNTF